MFYHKVIIFLYQILFSVLNLKHASQIQIYTLRFKKKEHKTKNRPRKLKSFNMNDTIMIVIDSLYEHSNTLLGSSK